MVPAASLLWASEWSRTIPRTWSCDHAAAPVAQNHSKLKVVHLNVNFQSKSIQIFDINFQQLVFPHVIGSLSKVLQFKK